MKILMTADTIGGVWTYSMELCSALGQHNVCIALATMGRKLSAAQYEQLVGMPHVQLFESEYRLCWMANSADDVRAAGDWLLGLEREWQPDVIHLNDLAHGGLPWLAPVLLVGHSCVLSWWEAVKHKPAPRAQWREYHQLVCASIANAALVVAPTTAMLAAMLWNYGAPRSSMVIPNGRSFPAISATPPQASPTSEVAPGPFIFSAGRLWDEAKNIQALAQVAKDVPWTIYVAGETDDPNGGSIPLSSLHFLGLLEQSALAEWLYSATIYAAPALYEPFGLSIVEAARSGCALVLGDIPSLREVWGEAALYVDPRNPQQLRETLLRLINDPLLREEMVQRARRTATAYDTAQMALEYLSCYRSLISGQLPAHISTQSVLGVSL